MTSARYYVPSGRFSGKGLLWGGLIGLPIGGILAVAYSYLTLSIPFVGKISLILLLLLGVGTGVGVAVGIRKGHIRNPAVALIQGIVIGLLTIYVMWVAWVFTLLSKGGEPVSMLNILLSPNALWAFVLDLNGRGAWSISGAKPTGIFLWLIWFIEAAVIVASSAFLSWKAAKLPYCEHCRSWCNEQEEFLSTELVDTETLRSNLQPFNSDFFIALPKTTAKASSRLSFDLSTCSCGRTNTLTVTKTSQTVEGGTNKEYKLSLLSALLIDRESVNVLLSVAKESA